MITKLLSSTISSWPVIKLLLLELSAIVMITRCVCCILTYTLTHAHTFRTGKIVLNYIMNRKWATMRSSSRASVDGLYVYWTWAWGVIGDQPVPCVDLDLGWALWQNAYFSINTVCGFAVCRGWNLRMSGCLSVFCVWSRREAVRGWFLMDKSALTPPPLAFSVNAIELNR